jgi:hypothetical protein
MCPKVDGTRSPPYSHIKVYFGIFAFAKTPTPIYLFIYLISMGGK